VGSHWHAIGDPERSRQRLEAVGATLVCTSFAECIALLEIRFPAGRRQAPANAGNPTAVTT